jgi:hypothetical protein
LTSSTTPAASDGARSPEEAVLAEPSESTVTATATEEPPLDGAAGEGAKRPSASEDERDGAAGRESPEETARTASPAESPRVPGDTPATHASDSARDEEIRRLKRELVRTRTLLEMGIDLARMESLDRWVDSLLLGLIAQAGVESAACFFHESPEGFQLAAAKGFETLPAGVVLPGDCPAGQEETRWGLRPVEEAPLEPMAQDVLTKMGFRTVAPLVVEGRTVALVALGAPIGHRDGDEWRGFVESLLEQAESAYVVVANRELQERRTLGLVRTLVSLIEENTLARNVTGEVLRYTQAVARRMHYPEEFLRDLLYGTLLRDIGMIKVSDLILRSPRELRPEEWEVIKRHPKEGAEMLRAMGFSDHAVRIVRCHHERFNGEGYPEGLSGSEIPLGARIVSVVESYTAMIQDRPNRPALAPEEALRTLEENWGMRYDPDVVRCFVDIVGEEIRTGRKVDDGSERLFDLGI